MNVNVYGLQRDKMDGAAQSTRSNKSEKTDPALIKVDQARKKWLLIIGITATVAGIAAVGVGIVFINPTLIACGAMLSVVSVVVACIILIVRKLRGVSSKASADRASASENKKKARNQTLLPTLDFKSANSSIGGGAEAVELIINKKPSVCRRLNFDGDCDIGMSFSTTLD